MIDENNSLSSIPNISHSNILFSSIQVGERSSHRIVWNFVCVDVQGVTESSLIEEVQEKITNALGEYTTDQRNSNPTARSPSNARQVPTSEQEKFACILLKLPDVRLIGNDLKKFLQLIDRKHEGKLLDGCLLGEMLNGLQSNT